MTTALKTTQLSVRFGEKVALNAIDLSISANGVTALLGANGAGKTTLINCALGLCKPSSGRLKIFSETPGKFEAKRLIGVMLQDSNLPDLLSAAEHIELFSTYYPDPLSLEQLSRQCGLETFIHKRYKTLSGGQKRRIQFALAILGRPKIVFLDEPTTGLDIDARDLVWNTINQLRDSGTAVLLTTHYLEEADALADHTIVMNEGNIIANDSTENIRAAASGAVIRCESRLDLSVIEALTDVRSAKTRGRQIEISSDNPTASLVALLALDPNLANLTVSKSNLEDAFIKLNNNSKLAEVAS
ncbi:MAG: ABC-2 type transport system ATP-binding protein [Arenicella sp.]|jgi:ABC-2 type transport system ATP-binding protein